MPYIVRIPVQKLRTNFIHRFLRDDSFVSFSQENEVEKRFVEKFWLYFVLLDFLYHGVQSHVNRGIAQAFNNPFLVEGKLGPEPPSPCARPFVQPVEHVLELFLVSAGENSNFAQAFECRFLPSFRVEIQKPLVRKNRNDNLSAGARYRGPACLVKPKRLPVAH